MEKAKSKFKTVDDYINLYPKKIRKILQDIRAVIKKEAPEAVETINYQMPTFKLKSKNLVHFAAWKNHIGFYPTPSGTEAFKKELSKYIVAKGSIQFPISEPIPVELIQKIVKFRVKEELGKSKK